MTEHDGVSQVSPRCPAPSLAPFPHCLRVPASRHQVALPCKAEKGTLFFPGVLPWFIYGLTFFPSVRNQLGRIGKAHLEGEKISNAFFSPTFAHLISGEFSRASASAPWATMHEGTVCWNMVTSDKPGLWLRINLSWGTQRKPGWYFCSPELW